MSNLFKKYIFSASGIIFIFSFQSYSQTQPPCDTIFYQTTIDAPTCPSDWQLEFEDEFDGDSLDLTNWLPSLPWQNGGGFGSATECDGLKNGTLEITNSNNISVSNGSLKLQTTQEDITARFVPYESDSIIKPDGLTNLRLFHFKSGLVYSQRQFSGPGKVEIRCTIPPVNGLWPSFWLYGSCGQEIDIFEFTSENSTEPTSTCSSRPFMTYHKEYSCGSSSTNCGNQSAPIDSVDYSSGPHVFSVEWDSYQITWRIDGIIRKRIYGLRSVTSGQPIDECNLPFGTYLLSTSMPTYTDMHIILAQGVINFCSPSNPVYRGTYPQTYEIEYVKYWKRINPPQTPDCDFDTKIVHNKIFHGDDTKHAENWIKTASNVEVKSGANVTWTAGDYIDLNDGFIVDDGGLFDASIQNCFDNSGLRLSQHTTSYPSENQKNNNPIELSVQPNPSEGIFIVKTDMIGQCKLLVCDVVGKIIYVNNEFVHSIDINISEFPKGIYFVKAIDSEGNMKVNKIIIQ